MKSNERLAACLLLLLLLVATLLPLVSWLMVAFGMPVHTFLSDEGLRWLFCNGLQCCCSASTMQAIVLFLALCSLWRAVSLPDVSNRGLRPLFVTFALLVVACLGLSLLAFGGSSPLLSVTGHILPESPFMKGLPLMLSLLMWLLAFVYAYMRGAVTTLQQFAALLTVGFVRFGTWICCMLLLSFNVNAIKYILQ